VSRISVELVPRSLASLEDDLRELRARFPAVDTVNVPDLLRFPLRSWDACRAARRFVPHAIPHLRAMDFPLDKPFPLADLLAEAGIDEVLVVAGDPPQDLGRPVYPARPAEWIRKLKQEAPELRVYGAFDPYRAGLRAELEAAHAKLAAGADGLFSQPFFDLRLLEVWAELLAGVRVWWGFSPVLSAATRRYWEAKNRAVFPAGFAPTLDWNRRFAETALGWLRARDADAYFMPIRARLGDWLGGLL
jgi:methylenetetrahydrofolate reductase (NADPH)